MRRTHENASATLYDDDDNNNKIYVRADDVFVSIIIMTS